MAASISVIIPALDEERWVAAAIGSVRAEASEVIVVDGGSRDGTRAIAEREGARVLGSRPGRGVQLGLGARDASGEWLVFLHADTRLDDGWAAALRAVPAPVVGGAFRFSIDAPGAGYRLLERGVACRCRLLGLPYGDQGLFARRETYEAVGGFPPFPLMEDICLVGRLRRAGRLALLRVHARTSPRRFERHGLVGTTARNLWLAGLYACGQSPERLARLYYGR